MSRVIQCFLESDLRSGHLGLSRAAMKEKVDVMALLPGEYVVFINSARDRVKVYASSNVIGYMIAAKGQKIDLGAIREIPRAFTGSGQIDYDKALKLRLEKELGGRVRIEKQPVAPHLSIVKRAQAKHRGKLESRSA